MIAVYIDPEVSEQKLFIKASIEYLLNTLGYQSRYIDSFDQLIATDTLLYYYKQIPENKVFVSFALKRPVILIPFCEEIYELDKIKKGRIEKLKQTIKIQHEIPVLSPKPVNLPVEIMQNEYIVTAKYNFDLIGNIMFFLSSREKELNEDSNPPFREENSLFFVDFDRPFIADYLQSFEMTLRYILEVKGFYLIKKEYWPSGEDFAFASTHTVDKLNKWTYAKIFSSILDILLLIPKFKWSTFSRQMQSIFFYMFRNLEQYWNFPEYREIEEKHGIKSSWFFAVDDALLTDYKFNDEDLQTLIQELDKTDQDISLLSFPDQENIDQLYKNEKRLQIASGKSSGVRFNNYKVDSSTYSRSGRAGLLYDSSVAFNSKAGFPNGMALPYKPITAKYRAEHYCYPVNFNDDALRIDKYKTVLFKQAKTTLKDILDEVKKCKGLLCLDLKLSNYFEIPFQGKLYNYILEKINDEVVFKGTLMEINEWWRGRAEVVAFEEEYELSIDFQESFENFTFRILGSKTISEITGAEYTIDNNRIHFTNVAKDAKVFIKFSAKSDK